MDLLQVNSRLPNIPQDLATEILSRSPIKSLLRFRCVCKSWCSLISNPKFTLSPSQRLRFVVMTRRFSDQKWLSSLYSIDKELDLLRGPSEPRWGNGEIPPGSFQFLGSCNGLLLIRENNYLFLWNPSTMEVLRVTWITCYCVASGLCYDSSTDDYKSVVGFHDKIIVYSFRNKKYARVFFYCRGWTLEPGPPTLNKRLHWLVKNRNTSDLQEEYLIVYFDSVAEEFVGVPSPPNKGDKGEILVLGLGVFDGSLSMVREKINRTHFMPLFEVLVMKEYGVRESWTTMFTISNFTGLWLSYQDVNLVPIWFKNNDEILMALRGDSILVYNYIEKTERSIRIPNNELILGLVAYEESIVSPLGIAYEGKERVTRNNEWEEADPLGEGRLVDGRKRTSKGKQK